MKISKKNQDPRQIDSDRNQLQNLMEKKSSHFAFMTAVRSCGRRGTVVGFGKEGIKTLRICWDDLTYSDIPNPRADWIKW